jgi:hypothetical protein
MPISLADRSFRATQQKDCAFDRIDLGAGALHGYSETSALFEDIDDI